MKFRLALLCLLSLAYLPGLKAQQPVKTPLVVVCSCDDLNSRMLESMVRDSVAASPRYYEIHPNREDKATYYRLILVALDDTPSSIAVSAVVLHGDSFVTSAVRVCGVNKLTWCAGTILSFADHAIQNR